MRCGAYEIVAPISTGAMGAVYRARHLESGKEVALKRLLERAGTRRFEIEVVLRLGQQRAALLVARAVEADDERHVGLDLAEGLRSGPSPPRHGSCLPWYSRRSIEAG